MTAKLAPPVLFCCAALVAAGAFARAPGFQQPAPAAPDKAAPDATVPADMIALRVQVVDKKGRYVDDARAEDFRVREDGAEQKVEFFAKEESPASYGIAVDNSGSMRKMFDLIARTGEAIVSANRPQDDAFVVRFVGSGQLQTLTDFTSSRETLAEAFSEMFAEGGETAVVDAAYAMVERVAAHRKAEPDRARAVILLTDGEDRRSAHKREELLELLRSSGVRVFSVGLVNSLDSSGGFIQRSPRERASALLDSLAEASGGRAFYPKTGEDLQQAIKDINRALRSHYVIAYRPASAARDGRFRKLKIELADAPGREGRKALAPAGYYARKPGDK